MPRLWRSLGDGNSLLHTLIFKFAFQSIVNSIYIDRNGQNQGMEQGIDQASGLVPGGLYFASAYIKFINPSKSYQRLELFVQLTDGKDLP